MSKTKAQLAREVEALQAQVAELESTLKATPPDGEEIQVSGIDIEWNSRRGTCTFETLPVAMMWIDTTLAGLMSGVQSMVGTERFRLALQSEGRKSVEADWQVISQYSDFREGFEAIANIAAVAGWGDWKLVSLDEKKRTCRFRVWNSWEGRYQKALGVCWDSGMLAGKLAGYCSRLFETNCWAEQTAFIARGDEFDEFVVSPSGRSIENEVENLLATDEATRADMAVALQKLRTEIAERKHVEERLRTLSSAVEQSASSIAILNTDGIVEYVNPKLLEVYQSSAEELVGKHWQPWLSDHSTLREHFEDIRSTVIERGEVWRGEVSDRAKSGEVIWRDAAIFPIQDAEGETTHYAYISRAVTERKQAEEALRASETRLRNVIDSIPLGMHMYQLEPNGELVFVDANPAADTILGVDHQQFVGKTLEEAFPAAAESEIPERYRAAASKGEAWYAEQSDYEDEQIAGAFEVHAFQTSPGRMVATFHDITERKQAELALKQYTERLKVMQEIDHDILAARSPEEIAQTAAQHLRQLVPCKFATVAMFDFEASEVVIFARAPAEDAPYPPGSRLPISTDAQDLEKLRRGEARVVEDIELLAKLSPAEKALQSGGVRAHVTIPLIARGELIGSLNFGSNTPGPFPPEHLEIAHAVANSLAIAIQQARLHEQAQHRAAELEALRRATLDISAQLDLDTLLKTLTESALELLGVSTGGIYLYRPERDVLEWVVAVGPNVAKPGTELRRGEGLSGKVWESGEPLVVDYYDEWQGRASVYEDFFWTAVVGVPIRWGDEFLGVVNALSDTPRRPFSEDEVRLLSLFADQAAVAIANARLFEAERRERVLAQNLRQSAEALVRSAHLEDTLSLIINQLGAVVPFDRALVMLAEGDDLRIVASQGFLEPAEITGKTYRYPDVLLLHAALGHDGALVVQNMQQDSRGAELLGDITLEGTWIGVRLIVWETVMGLLTISSQEPDCYGTQDIEAVKAFAHQAALALEHDRIVRELESRVADLQEAQNHLMRVARLSAAREVAAGVAHQINNPLTAVILESDMLLEELETNHPGYESAQAIHEAAERAGAVTRRLLDLSRLEPLSMKLLNVNDSLQNTITLIRSQVEPTILLVIGLAPRLPLIEASQDHIEDVWINFLLNARDAVRDVEGGTIRVSSALNVKDQSIIVTIKDNGAGIPAEHLDRVFDPFFTTKAERQGTGLGLSVCHDIVARHGGSIQVESAEGQGTTFVVTLPLGRGSVMS
ncbi:MAG: GAF domain-containing protein, partial [Anaerolineae bacterium]